MNPTGAPGITALIDETGAKHPADLALCDEQISLNYAACREKTDAIAAGLRQRGIGPGAVVALIFPQSVEAIVSMLGVLKTGAAYVVLDADEPAKRMTEIIQDAGAALIITGRNVGLAADPTGVEIVNFANLEMGTAPGGNLGTADDLAYLCYTSGSTGKPKGVKQTQGNLAHFAAVYAQSLAISADDNLSMLYSLNFSASNMDIFAGLLSGATVCLYDLKNKGLSALYQWLQTRRITILHTVPSIFRNLVTNAPAGYGFDLVRGIDLGGEAVFASDLDLLRKHFRADCLCLNHFAATEASVIAQQRLDPSLESTPGVVPVGRAAAGMIIRIVDTDQQPVTPGQTGEIVLESPYLSPGYHNLAAINAKVFSTTPEGCRSYRTGDLGWLDEDGQLHYQGRNDFRVKIRGVTIEIGEIEAALHSLAGVRNAVAVHHKSGAEAEGEIVAFVVLLEPQALNHQTIRLALASCLPQSMRPARFVFLDSLPVTATGKIDRKALDPQAYPAVRDQPTATPASNRSLEKDIAEIFSQLLKTATIDHQLTFYDQGGSSLAAMNLVLRLEKKFQVEVPLDLMHNDATVAKLADFIAKSGSRGQTTCERRSLLTALKVHDKPYRLFLIHGRDGHALTSPYFAGLLSENHSFYVLRAKGLQPGEEPNTSIEGMAADYIREIRRVQPQGPYFIVGLCAGSVVALHMVKQLSRTGALTAPVILIDPPHRSLKPIAPGLLRSRLREMYAQLEQHDFSEYEEFAVALKNRAEEDKIEIDLDNPETLGRTAKVVIGFNIAINSYDPRPPYQGEVLCVYSQARLNNIKKHGDVLITGKIKRFVVAANHADILDVKNQTFVKCIRDCLAYSIAVINQQIGAPLL
jgi:amino acid adenylation domain-containing protein